MIEWSIECEGDRARERRHERPSSQTWLPPSRDRERDRERGAQRATNEIVGLCERTKRVEN